MADHQNHHDHHHPSRPRSLGHIARRYASAIAAFLGAAGWGVSQILESSDALRDWYHKVGLWPMIALATIGVLGVRDARQREIFRAAIGALRSHTTEVSGAIKQLMERDEQHTQAIDKLVGEHHELRQEVRSLHDRMDQTGPTGIGDRPRVKTPTWTPGTG